MPKIVIANLANRTIIFKKEKAKILDTIHEEYIDWMFACGGRGRCTTCKMIVLEGKENLSADTIFEEKYRELGRLKDNERLACQVTASGDVVIKVPSEGKLPHMKYDD
jgi:ferredoxin, 2Fe-2S